MFRYLKQKDYYDKQALSKRNRFVNKRNSINYTSTSRTDVILKEVDNGYSKQHRRSHNNSITDLKKMHNPYLLEKHIGIRKEIQASGFLPHLLPIKSSKFKHLRYKI